MTASPGGSDAGAQQQKFAIRHDHSEVKKEELPDEMTLHIASIAFGRVS